MRKTQFTQAPSRLVKDKDISLAAKGLFAFMQDKPDNWNFTIKSMSKQLKEGENAIRTCLNQLREFGWITYTKHSDGTGTYSLNFAPERSNPNDENPHEENHHMDKPSDENPNDENPHEENPMMGKSSRIKQTDSLNRQIDKQTDCSYVDKSPSKKSTFDFSIIPPGVSKEDALNFIEHRKLIKKPLTQRAFVLAMQNFCTVASQLEITSIQLEDGTTRTGADQLIDYTIEAGWQSVKAEWVRNREGFSQHQASSNGKRYQALTVDDLSGEW